MKIIGFSSALNVIILLSLLTFTLYLVDNGGTNYSTPFLSLVGSVNEPGSGQDGQLAGLNTQLLAVFAVLGFGGLVAGVLSAFSIGFPNPYVIFAPVAYFVMGFFFFPLNLLNNNSGLPAEIRAMLVFLISSIMLFAVYDLSRQR